MPMPMPIARAHSPHISAARYFWNPVEGIAPLIVSIQDIIGVAREMFDIQEGTRIIVSADISSFDNERMEIDPGIWSALSGELSMIWIATHPDQNLAPSTSSLEHEHGPRPNPISESDADARGILCQIMNATGNWVVPNDSAASQPRVFVHKNATFYDLKQAIFLKKPELRVEGLHLGKNQRTSASTHFDHNDTCRMEKDTYHIFYDPTCCTNQ